MPFLAGSLGALLSYGSAAASLSATGLSIANSLSSPKMPVIPPPPGASLISPAGQAAASDARRRAAAAGGLQSTVTGAATSPNAGPTSGGKTLLGA